MKLADATWQDVQSFDKRAVILIPTGSLEQHGPHLPLFTDSLLVTSVAESVEARVPNEVVLTPTLWLGASGHHLKFPGTLSASFPTFQGAIHSVVESLVPHGFTKFFVLNGHGGNNEPNGIAVRELKALHPSLTFGHAGYYSFIEELTARTLEGPTKEMRHACEAEASLVMHLRPDLVRLNKLRNDGLRPDPPLKGMVHHFDEMTEEGSFGYATLAKPEKGKVLFEAAVDAISLQIKALAHGYVLSGEPASNM